MSFRLSFLEELYFLLKVFSSSLSIDPDKEQMELVTPSGHNPTQEIKDQITFLSRFSACRKNQLISPALGFSIM